MKKKVVSKHKHPLLIFILVSILLFGLSWQYGYVKRTLDNKQIAIELMKDGEIDLAVNYCKKMDYRNYECFNNYLDAKQFKNEKIDPSVCKEINVGKVPFFTSNAEENDYFLTFRQVKARCYNSI